VNEEQRIQIVAALVAAMVKRGEIFEDQMLQARDELMAASDQGLIDACEDLCPEELPGDLRRVGF
jgi:hypothetical protein